MLGAVAGGAKEFDMMMVATTAYLGNTKMPWASKNSSTRHQSPKGLTMGSTRTAASHGASHGIGFSRVGLSADILGLEVAVGAH